MRYLITRGAGFIGSHLSEALLLEGHEVFVIDDLSTGSVDNICHLKQNPSFHLVVDTIFNEPLTAEFVDLADVVVHFAAAVGVFQIVKSPVRTIETNIGGTEIVLKHASKKGKPTLVASTSEVYGKSNKIPFSENDDCVLGASSKARWSYAVSKLVDEFLALSYYKEKHLPTIVVRFFNTVGPRQTGRYGMVVPRFIRQALDGGPITVFGDGTQSRCFGYVGDIVDTVVRLTREPKAYGQVFNIGNDREITVNALAELVRRRVNPDAKIVHVPYEEAYGPDFEDMKCRVPDLSKIRGLIGHRSHLGIEGILDIVIEYHRQERMT